MSETRKRAFTLELTDEDLKDFITKCYRDGTTPAEVLEGFINDLIDGSRTRGSDERMYAGQYYERCGYGYFFPDDSRTFTQWLLYEYGEYTLKEIIDSLETIADAQGDISFYRDHPEEEPGEGELEALEDTIKAEEETIGELYQEYTTSTRKPDSLEDGIKGVREYLEMIEKIKEGGAI